MPTLINNSKQLQVEHHILLNKLAVESQQMVGNGIGKMIGAAVGRAAGRVAKSAKTVAEEARTGFRVGRRVGVDASYKHVAGIKRSRAVRAGVMGGMSVAKAGRFASSHPKALIGGAAGTGALVGGAALSRKKRTTTNEEPMTTVLVNNSEQIAVEHRMVLNRLTAQTRPNQMIDNGIGSLLGKAGKAAGRLGRQFKAGRTMGKIGLKTPVATQGKAFRAGQFSTTGAGKATMVGGAALGGAGVGAMIPRKKKRQVA